jgi:putative methionine-R-sulfoxide reductase with GAF domain
MLNKFFSPPVFLEDDEKTRSAYYLNVIILSNIPIILLFIIIRTIAGNPLFGVENLIVMTTIPVLFAAWFLSKRGLIKLAANTYVAIFWIVSTLYGLSTAGMRGSTFASYFVSMLMAGLLLGWRPALIYTFLSIVAAFGMAFSENLGVISYTPKSAFGISLEGTVLFIFGGIFLYLIINSLESAIKKEKINATALQSTNEYLSEMRNALEKRVEERTKEIENEQVKALRRSRQFEGIARVSRAISKTRNLQEVLSQIAQAISEQFDFYHVGIFLNDAVNQYAILSAANSEGGKRMLDRGHQLKIGEQGIVGFVTGSGTPRIALDVGTDNVYFNNPDLPLTHSEMALPLKSGNDTIGALDIQSIEQNAFSDDDIEVLESLADQVSLAIQNARLFDQTNKLLSEAEAIQKQYQRNTWGRLSREK